MRRSVGFTSRLLVVVSGLTLLSIIVAPGGRPSGPYVSPLANLTVGSALAGPGCENRACATDPKTLKFICVKNTGTTCAAYNSKGPIASKCIENAC